ncbi:hypothetical protein J3R30DRAFT_705496 [Lentinula aciculospora]|uniref:F-box domain-containing protein n=1 Tax=Lentinula aciculospora TaxID=153920 RepID=A0A9W9A534_9AGAR|nr:hypothetical protein J3R30DRAFT_705496 [Lentinula aciculospora]
MVEQPFDHLLTSNYSADDSEIPDIRFALVDAQDRLRSLEEKLAELELSEIEGDLQSLNERAHERDDIIAQLLLCDEQRAHITKLQSTLSPLRRFPFEILSLVFSFALSNSQKGVSMNPSSVFWGISQVCRLWREVACEGMPHVWSSIEIDCVGMNGQNPTSTLLELALRRSGTRPLSIRFYFSHKDKLGVLSESEKACLDLLAIQSFRWKEVELQYISIAALDGLSVAVKGRIPLLRRLVVENVPVSLAADTPSTAEAFQVAPQLRHFSLSGFFRPSRFYLPWSQLDSYSGSFRDFHDFLFVLESAGNLNTCDVFWRNYHPGLMFDHLNMRTMRIHGELMGLSRLRLPYLQKLALDDLLIRDLGTVSAFLRRTPSVTSLEVYVPYDMGVANSIDLLSEFMDACSNVTSLVLMGEFDMRSLCSLLNTSKSGQVVMPRLQHLSLFVLSTTNSELANILGVMVESRTRTSQRSLDNEYDHLSSLTLHALREPSVILECLKPLEETFGLSVIVKLV